jgi:hypothetical protein
MILFMILPYEKLKEEGKMKVLRYGGRGEKRRILFLELEKS